MIVLRTKVHVPLHPRFFLLFLTAAFLQLPQPLTAGSPEPEEDILRPVPYRLTLGAIAGAGWNMSTGSFETLCRCEHSGGSGFSWMAGAVVDVPVNGTFSVTGMLVYEDLSTSYEKTTTRYVYVEHLDAITPVDFGVNTDVGMGYITASVLGTWHFGLGGLYAQAGPSLGYLVQGSITEEEHIITPGYVYESGGGRQQTSMDGSLDRYYDVTDLRFALLAGVGYDVELTGTMVLSPEIHFSIPVNSPVGAYSSWKIFSARVAVQLRVGI